MCFTGSSSEIQASPNTSTSLPCNVSIPVDKIEVSLININWTRDGSEVASFGEATTQIKDGFSWDTADFINGDFSLTVLTATLSLQGMYECKVSYNFSSLHSSNVTFTIQGMYCSLYALHFQSVNTGKQQASLFFKSQEDESACSFNVFTQQIVQDGIMESD